MAEDRYDNSIRGGNGAISAPDPRIPPTGQSDTAVRPWDARNSAYGGPGSLVLMLAQEADEIPAWGTQIIHRDRLLREFWPQENYFASALSSIAKKYAAFKFTLDGPTRMTNITRRLLHNYEHGKGWKAFWTKLIIDVSTQDNGGFAEVVRIEDDPRSPVIQLNHLDAGRCRRTGDWDQPVMYWDRVGVPHLLNWYQVLTFEDMESPIEAGRGIGYCTLGRILRHCQIERDYSIFKKEKIGGRWTRTIHLVNGVSKDDIKNAMNLSDEEADANLIMRYKLPLILTTIDPTTPIAHQQIDLAALPENFDEEVHLKWYMTLLAMTFGVDYTEFAPMMSGHLGSGQQSQTMATKARGKGPANWMIDVESKLNFHGIVPPNVNFIFEEQDTVEEGQQIMLDWRLAQVMSLLCDPKSGEPVLSTEIARQILRDKGFLRPEYLEAMGDEAMRPAPVQAFTKSGETFQGYQGPLSITARQRLATLGLEPYNYKSNTHPAATAQGLKTMTSGNIYYVRHGETPLNSEDKLRAWTNVPLDQTGRKEAAKLGQSLMNKIDVIVTSDLDRARDTAEIISQITGVPISEETLSLRPWDLGSLAGQSVSDTLPVIKEYALDKPQEPIQGGESFNSFKARYLTGISDIMNKYPGQNVAVVSHHRGDRILAAWEQEGSIDFHVDPNIFLQRGMEPGSYRVIPFKDLQAGLNG